MATFYCLFISIMAVAAPARQQTEKDLGQLQGTWELTEIKNAPCSPELSDILANENARFDLIDRLAETARIPFLAFARLAEFLNDRLQYRPNAPACGTNDTNDVIFSGRKMKFGRQGNFILKIDETTTPKQIDLTPVDGRFKGVRHVGIYELDGNTLRICTGDHTQKVRPTDFTAPMDSRLINITLVRKK